MAAVGLLFAPLAPLVVVAAAVVFWISSFVYKYQLMFVFVSKVESGGVSLDFVSDLKACADVRFVASLECRHQSPARDSAIHAGPHGSE